MGTRGVFALILNKPQSTLLLVQRRNNNLWELPGGGVEPGESDREALTHEVMEETGLRINVLHKVADDLPYKDDVCAAYLCASDGVGLLPQTDETAMSHFTTLFEVREQSFRRDGMTYPLVLAGPHGRMGRMKRMIYDGFSLLGETLDYSCPVPIEESSPDIQVSHDGTKLAYVNGFTFEAWRRIDPYSPTGFAQLRSAAATT